MAQQRATNGCPYSVVVSADQDLTPIVRGRYGLLRSFDTVRSQ